MHLTPSFYQKNLPSYSLPPSFAPLFHLSTVTIILWSISNMPHRGSGENGCDWGVVRSTVDAMWRSAVATVHMLQGGRHRTRQWLFKLSGCSLCPSVHRLCAFTVQEVTGSRSHMSVSQTSSVGSELPEEPDIFQGVPVLNRSSSWEVQLPRKFPPCAVKTSKEHCYLSSQARYTFISLPLERWNHAKDGRPKIHLQMCCLSYIEYVNSLNMVFFIVHMVLHCF